ncbi:hypothetical protein BDV93DRAFT_83944 [Ceratobasidium sp. AG-I]|nr:hypothetical protein BDV93DRAFT_83944 [Ceratobasidium sp. AG-I]
MDDADDEFLYGDSSAPAAAPPVPVSTGLTGDDVLDFELDEPPYETPPRTNEGLPPVQTEQVTAPVGLGLPADRVDQVPEEQVQSEDNDPGEEEDEEDEEEDEESEDDLEIITEAPTRSVDFRSVRGLGGPAQPPRGPPLPSQNRPVHLTTEYAVRARPTDPGPNISSSLPPSTLQPSETERATQLPPDAAPSHSQQYSPQPPIQSQLQTPQNQIQIQPLPELLPDPVRAPPSHPSLDPSAPGLLVVPGTLQARPVWEVDLDSLSSKSWRRPGANLSDWFNYGFDEISWETYCMRRKELGETASGLKANVLNVAGLPEDQLLNLPPDMRSVVLGTAAMLPLPGQGPGPNNMMIPGQGPGVNGKRMVSGAGMGPGGMGGHGMNDDADGDGYDERKRRTRGIRR